MKPRKPINRISKKRLAKEFNNKLPFSTVGRSPIGKMTDFDSVELGSTPRRPSIPKISAKQIERQQKLNEKRFRWWIERPRVCGICGLGIQTFEEYVLDHIKPRGMGGGFRDDSDSNLQPAHFICNSLKGSRRI